MGTNRKKIEYFEKGKASRNICPKCHKKFSHRNKRRCPNCGVFLEWPGEYFPMWEMGYFWIHEEYRDITELKEWILKNTIKEPWEHYGSIAFDGETYFWRDTI